MAALRAGGLWRLAALFVAANGVPLIVGAWLVAFLTQHATVRTAVAGGLAFVLFGLTTIVRAVAPRIMRGGRDFAVLAGGGLLVAAGGLAALALGRSVPTCGSHRARVDGHHRYRIDTQPNFPLIIWGV